MAKLILLSLLFATVMIPMRAARDESPQRGLRRAVLWAFAANALYFILILYVYPRFA